MTTNVTDTPLMQQYEEMKKKYPAAILLFRVGDFYETFSDDAKTASEILDITLTTRTDGIYLAGFPHRALDSYLPKLVRAGHRVAICEQLEDPKLTKNLVKRGITELVTPGLPTQSNEPAQIPAPASKSKKQPQFRDILYTDPVNNSNDDILSLGEPIAWFDVEIPKEAASLKLFLDKERDCMAHIIIHPDAGKLVATDTRVLQTIDIECRGIWPAPKVFYRNGNTNDEKCAYTKPFTCHIHTKALNAMIGKTVSVAVYEYKGNQALTVCEAPGMITKCLGPAYSMPNWELVMPTDGYFFKLRDDLVKPLQKWVKEKVREFIKQNPRVVLRLSGNSLNVRIMEADDDLRDLCVSSYWEVENEITPDFTMMFDGGLFLGCIQHDDFKGQFIFRADNKPMLMTTDIKKTLIMPLLIPQDYSNFADDTNEPN